MLAQAGIEQRAPLTTLTETIEALRALWSGERTTYRGKTVTLEQVQMELTPVQSHLPITLGTQGPRGLALAGRIAAAENVRAALAHQTNISLGCYCEDETLCHRSVLRELLAERGASIAGGARNQGDG